MNFSLRKLVVLSGAKASIYAVWREGEQSSIFEQFLEKYETEYPDELKDIYLKIVNIGGRTGARKQFFKEKEGKPGDLVCALYDEPDKNLRLYCIRLGETTVILGGGAIKDVASWQDDPELKQSAGEMIEVSAKIKERMKDRDLGYDQYYLDLTGDLNFYD